MRVVSVSEYSSLEAVRELVTRPHLDEVSVSKAVLERTKEIFGTALTPTETVTNILQDIKTYGDGGLIKYIDRIDGQKLTPAQLFVTAEEFRGVDKLVSQEFKESLKIAIDNIARFHKRQLENSWFSTEQDGIILGQRVTPIERVGIYVPGGNAPLVSSLIMSAVPAKVAGVSEIIMATPLRDGKIDAHLLMAARACGVDKILKAGGAQAIGALAYGTETVQAVDKIVGPGNIYVTLAKKMVYGRVGIESIAGPSEILIIADDTVSPAYVAADLLSQAEHDWEASAVLITPSKEMAEAVQIELKKQLACLSTAKIAAAALNTWGLIVITDNIKQAVDLANIFAPEHLELLVANPWDLVSKIKHAGAIFLGKYSAEPIGDYVAGPNHILPTNGTARFSSSLTTNDFLKKSSIIYYTAAGILKYGSHAVKIADCEGLAAHSNAISLRIKDLEAGEENNEK